VDSANAIGELITSLGLPMVAIIAFLRRWIITAGEHAELRQQLVDERSQHAAELARVREETRTWQRLALQSSGLADAVTRAAERGLVP
jgi:hypothetical protein